MFGFSTMTTSRKYMSTIYGQSYPIQLSHFVAYRGQLIEVRRNCFEQTPEYGIIIECKYPHFGIGYDDDYWVYIGGELTLVKNFQIYPVDLH